MLQLCSILLLLFWVITVASTMPLQKGMELRYEGELTENFTFANQPPLSFTRRLILVVEVMEVSPTKEAEISQMNFTEVDSDGKVIRHSNVHFGKVSQDGKAVQDRLTLPYLFFTHDRLKEGTTWGGEEILLEGFFPTPLKGRVVYRVLRRTELDGVPCWLILRYLVKPVTLTEDERKFIVPRWTDRFWVDAKTGLVRKLQRRWQYYAPESPRKRIWTPVMEIALKQINNLQEETQRRLRSELERMRLVKETFERDYEHIRKSEEKLKQMEQMVIDTIAALRESPYADFYLPYLERLLESLRFWQEELEAHKLVGKPAPDFELPTVDNTEKVKLSDLRGRVILLNFFSHW